MVVRRFLAHEHFAIFEWARESKASSTNCCEIWGDALTGVGWVVTERGLTIGDCTQKSSLWKNANNTSAPSCSYWLVYCEENMLDRWLCVTAGTLGGHWWSGAAGIVVVWSLIVGIIGSWLDMMGDYRVGCMVCGDRRVFLFRRSNNPHTKTGG